jgi:hypothetical protein
MNKEEFLKELLQYTEENCITINYTDEMQTDIEDGGNFIGGIEGTWMSEILGNVYYESLEAIGTAVYNYITNELGETIEEVLL